MHFDRNVPAQTKTTGGLQATLSAMIRFDTDVESTVQYESSETTAPTPDSTVGDVSGWNAPVRKGMSQFDVERRLGQAVGCTDNTSGTLTSVVCRYDLGDATAEITFVNNSLVGYVIESP